MEFSAPIVIIEFTGVIKYSDIMEVIPNTWENADRLCEILGKKDQPLSKEDLPSRVPMEENAHNI